MFLYFVSYLQGDIHVTELASPPTHTTFRPYLDTLSLPLSLLWNPHHRRSPSPRADTRARKVQSQRKTGPQPGERHPSLGC